MLGYFFTEHTNDVTAPCPSVHCCLGQAQVPLHNFEPDHKVVFVHNKLLQNVIISTENHDITLIDHDAFEEDGVVHVYLSVKQHSLTPWLSP